VPKTPFFGQIERVFCSSIIDYSIRIDGASYLNGYCSLMFFMHVFNVFFYKSEKNVFLFFWNLQINVFNFYSLRTGRAFSLSHIKLFSISGNQAIQE